MNKNLVFVFAALTLLAACAGKEEYNGLDHGGIKYEGETVAYKVNYTVKLNDPNVHEVADVLVQYIDAEGSVRQDSVTGIQWQKPVTYKKTATMEYGLAAHFFAKRNPSSTAVAYDFGADLSSALLQLSSAGDSLQIAVLRSQKDDCTGLLRYGDGKMSREEALSQDGAGRMDTTSVYFRYTSLNNDSAMVRKKFEWKE